ncbi:MAG: hypothetical protein ACOC8D_00535, partial [bacterium]
YRAKWGEEVREVGVVNVDPRETDTRSVPLKYLSKAADLAKSDAVAVADEGEGLDGEGRRPLWHWLAAVAAAALAGEMVVLALWKSRRRGVRAGRRAAREVA